MADDLIKRSDAIDLLLRLRDEAGNEDMAFALNFAAKESFPLIPAQKPGIDPKEIIVVMTELLPHEPSKIWACGCGDEILCENGQTAEAIADLIDAIHGDQISNTGFYDPVEDVRCGTEDRRTGYYYVN